VPVVPNSLCPKEAFSPINPRKDVPAATSRAPSPKRAACNAARNRQGCRRAEEQSSPAEEARAHRKHLYGRPHACATRIPCHPPTRELPTRSSGRVNGHAMVSEAAAMALATLVAATLAAATPATRSGRLNRAEHTSLLVECDPPPRYENRRVHHRSHRKPSAQHHRLPPCDKRTVLEAAAVVQVFTARKSDRWLVE
jgi:hypothetical protein